MQKPCIREGGSVAFLFCGFTVDVSLMSTCPFAPVFAGGHMDSVAENILEIIGVVIADARGDLRDGHVRVDEEVLCFTESAQCDVAHRGKADIGFEDMREVVGIGVCRRGDIFKVNIFPIVFIEVRFDECCETGFLFFERFAVGSDPRDDF